MQTEITGATSERYKQELGNMARRRLLTYPDCQAEVIAKHYAAHATSALQILKMVEYGWRAGGNPELDRSIQRLVDEIKNNHWHDFGIELEWPNNARDGYPGEYDHECGQSPNVRTERPAGKMQTEL